MRLRSSMLWTAALAAATPAFARVTPNPPGRAVLDPNGPVAAPLTVSATNALPVGLPAGAVQLDSTWYDLQDMGSLGHRITVGGDLRVHAVWQDDFCELGGGCPPNLGAPQPFPNRGMAYAWRSTDGTWHNDGKVRDPALANLRCCAAADELGGFGGVTLMPDGRAVIAQHINEESCDLRGQFDLQNTVGGSSFTGYLPPIASGVDYLFPQVAIASGGALTLLGEIPHAGVYDETVNFATSYFPTTGTSYTCFHFQGGAWINPMPLALFRDGRPAFPCIGAGSDGRVGIAVGDFGGNVWLCESSNGSFAPGTVRIRNLTNTTDAQVTAADSTSTQWRSYVHCSLAYADTTPHVVWAELQARRVAGTVQFFDWRSRIRHWSSDRGVETVHQVQPGVADHYDDVDNGLAGPLAGFNTLSVDWPQVGFSEDGSEIYVCWLGFTDANVDPTADMQLTGICTGVGYGDIYCSVARSGVAWSAPENLTNTPRTDERFFSLAERNPGGVVRLLFQTSATDQAGCAIIGDRGTSPGNVLRRIAYLEKHPAASVLAVDEGPARGAPSLRAYPNPILGAARIHFSAAPDVTPSRRVEIYAVDGRRIQSLALAGGSVQWDGHGEDGSRSPSGVYFARLSDDPASRAVRFILAR